MQRGLTAAAAHAAGRSESQQQHTRYSVNLPKCAHQELARTAAIAALSTARGTPPRIRHVALLQPRPRQHDTHPVAMPRTAQQQGALSTKAQAALGSTTGSAGDATRAAEGWSKALI